MAAGGGEKLFHLPLSNINVIVTEGNIIETSAEAVTTGEDKNLEGRGGVSQVLLKKCPKAYKRAREELKKNTKTFEFGKIYPVPFPMPASGGRKDGVSFGVVFHAVVPSPKMVTDRSQWAKQMTTLYYNLFKAANNQGRASLALPLLGSGQAGANKDVAADVLASALTSFRMKQDIQGLRHHLRDIIVYARKDAFTKMIAAMETKLKALPPQPPNGIVAPSSVRPGSSAGSSRLSSSSAKIRTSMSGKSKSKMSGNSQTKASREGSASATKSGCDATVSNWYYIVKNLTLESAPEDFAGKLREKEESMDCNEFVDDYNDDEDADSQDDDDEEEQKCAICLDDMTDPKKLEKCGHLFCRECIESSFKQHKPVCPSCNMVYGMIMGNQPRGTMSLDLSRQSLPGHHHCGMIVIDYVFPNGIQGAEHPNPGEPYRGTSRRAFLPNSPEGKKVYRLLRVAFENRLVFTIGRSVTTGFDNVVTWNDIHHKTNPAGGATGFGYPDPHYLSRVQEELAAKGVTEESLKGRTFDL